MIPFPFQQGGFGLVTPPSAGGGGGGSDPLFASVTALLLMATDFTDVKGNTWTASNGATVTGGEGEFDGDAWISAPSSANFGFGSGDFCAEGFFSADVLSGNMCLLDTRTGANAGIGVYAVATSIGNVFAYADNGGVVAGSGTFTIGASVHWAMAREGTTVRGYLGGVQQFTTTDSRTLASASTCFIGDNYVAPSQPIDGQMPGGVRITKGDCRYPGGTTFTPPASFPTS